MFLQERCLDKDFKIIVRNGMWVLRYDDFFLNFFFVVAPVCFILYYRPYTCLFGHTIEIDLYEGDTNAGGSVKHVVSPSKIRTPIVCQFVDTDFQADIYVQRISSIGTRGIPMLTVQWPCCITFTLEGSTQWFVAVE